MQLRVTMSLTPLFCSMLAFSAPADNLMTVTPETVIANVDGAKITYGEFEAKRAHNLLQAQNNFYSQERQVLDDYINDYLLQQQAKKEGVTVDQLLDRHVKSTLPKDPSEEALHVYYEGVDSKEPYEALRGKILDRIRQLRFERAKLAYVQNLRSQSTVAVTLPPPRADLAFTNTPILGDPNASVMVAEFADYECPVCQQVEPVVEKLQAEYKGKVSFAFKDMPLPMHPHAEKAAEAARCAGVQGKYWDFHNQLFASKKLEVPDLKATAQKMNLDTTAFNQCLDSGAQASVVKAQLSQGEDLGVPGTPDFFVNGRPMGNATYEQMRAVIEEELKASGNQAKQTAQR